MTTQLLGRPPATAIELDPSYFVDRAAEAVPAPNRQARVLRFATLTAFAAPANFVLYALLLQFTAASAAGATVVAALCVIIPKFFASKYWVWKQETTENLRREVLVYFGVTGASLTFAVSAAWLLEGLGATNSVLVAGNLGAFTVMWVARFVILDRFGFVSVASSEEDF